MGAFLVLMVTYSLVQFSTVSARSVAKESSSEDSSEEDLNPKEEACVQELNLNRTLIIELNDLDIAPDDNEEFNRFTECYWKKENWLQGSKVDYAKIVFSLDEMVMDELKGEDDDVKTTVKIRIAESVEFCKQNPPPEGKTFGQTAVRIQNCVIGKLLEDIQFIADSSEEEYELSSKEEECINELHLDRTVILDLLINEYIPEDNEVVGKFLTCYWKKEEWMTEYGRIDYDKLDYALREMIALAYMGEANSAKVAARKRVSTTLQYCQENSTKGRNEGQTIAKLQNCITKRLNKGYTE